MAVGNESVNLAIGSLADLKAQMLAKLINYLPKLIGVAVIFVIGFIIIKIITKIVEHFFARVNFDRSAETFVENLVKVALWIVLIIILLANLGIDVSGLVAGLGIMGFIVGFALKDTLGNLAAGVFILFHRPFKVGDFVDAAGVKGTVDRIGISATEIHTFDGKKVTIPNGRVWGKAITNYSGLKERRLEMVFGIHYDSDINKSMKVLNALIKREERILEDPEPQVIVKELADSSVNLAVRVFVKKEDYWATKFDFLKAAKENFDKNKIVIPYPQREVHQGKRV
ncbi:MAG: mechanosensitive ion channel family protein [Candidatus Woesearchaeota archaeon]|jgi:small conductance mechanosensitive channel|nr:mechanosensitive ion channel family protein [Candidatus Woesearchaeota archaeon]